MHNTIEITYELLNLRFAHLASMCYAAKLNSIYSIDIDIDNDNRFDIIVATYDHIIKYHLTDYHKTYLQKEDKLQISLLDTTLRSDSCDSTDSQTNNNTTNSCDSEDSNIGKTINEYKIIKYIGKGTSCKVYLATNKDTRQQYAIKIIKNNTNKNKYSSVNKFNVRKEIAIMKKLHHPNIIRLIDAIFDIDNGIMYIILDYLPNGCLIKYSKDHNNTYAKNIFTKQKIVRYVTHIVKGLIYLHAHNIIHRDLKPENIMLDSNDRVILVDFGMSSFISGNDRNNRSIYAMKGSYYFMPPELLNTTGAGYKSDVWSLGIIIYLMMFGVLPFNGNAEIDILESILDSTIVIPDTFLDGTLVDDAARDLIRRMICRDINKRVEVQDILSLPYFTDDVGIFIDSTEDCKRMLPFLSASSIESANSNYLTTKKSIKDTSSSDRSCSIISDPFNLICGEWSGRDGNVSIGNDNDNNDNDDNDDGDDCGDGNKKFIPQPPPTAKRDKLDRSKYIDKIKNIKEHRKLTITDIDQSITFID